MMLALLAATVLLALQTVPSTGTDMPGWTPAQTAIGAPQGPVDGNLRLQGPISIVVTTFNLDTLADPSAFADWESETR